MIVDSAVVIEILKLIHLVGLAMGLGGAIFADLLGLRLLLLAESRSLAGILDRLHLAIGWGLGIVWVSGVVLILLRYGLADIPNKIYIKYVLVSLITINAIFIGRTVLPIVRGGTAPLVYTLSQKHIVILTLASSVSFIGWMATLLVAKISTLQQMPILDLLGDIVIAWALCATTMLLLMGIARISPTVLAAVNRFRPNDGYFAVPIASHEQDRHGAATPRRNGVRQAAVKRATPARFEPAKRRRERMGVTEATTQRGGRSRLGRLFARLQSGIHNRLAKARGARERNAGELPARLNEIERGEVSADWAATMAETTGAKRASMEHTTAASKGAEWKTLRSGPPMNGNSGPETPYLGSETFGSGSVAPGAAAAKANLATGRVDPQPATHKTEKPSVRRAFAACRNAFWGAVQISLVTNLLVLAGPLFMLQVYDRVLSSGSMPTLVALFTIVACLFAFIGALEIIRSRILVRVALRTDRYLRDAIATSVLQIAPTAGRSRSIIVQDLDRLRQFISSSAPIALFDLPWAPIYFAVIFMFHWILGVVALSGAALLMILSGLNQALSHGPSIRAAKETEDSIAAAEAGGRNAEALHSMGMVDTYRRRWLEAHRQSLRSHTKASDITGSFYVATKVTRLFLQSLMLAAGAYLAILEMITPGVMIAASIIMARALAPVEQVAGQWRGFIAARQAAKRIGTHIEGLSDADGRTRLPEPAGHLRVERVYASPPGTVEPVLKGLDFALEPGDALGVIGPSASGKSTLARVLVGVWPTLRGEVRLDGAALRQWRPDQFGRNVGYLAQDIELFDGTIAENIVRLDHVIDEEKLFAAARTAGVHELVLNLPDGYNTRIGFGGIELSGGQRQRIALARAVYGGPVLIVLDEPNSNLDQEGDLALAAAITQLRQEGRTVVVFAHKESVLAVVSHLLVLRNGRQTVFGPKRDVLSDFLKARKAKLGSAHVKPVEATSDVA